MSPPAWLNAGMSTCIGYLRVSSITQVDGDGLRRQREAIERRAAAVGAHVAAWHADEGVSGTAALAQRPALVAALAALQPGDALLVEKADRLARDLVEGELILREARRLGVRVVEAEGGTDLTAADGNPTAALIRQVLGAVAQFEKSALVAKLRAARDRIRRETGRCEGPAPYPPEVAQLVRKLRRGKNPLTGRRRSLRAVARELDRRGVPTRSGRPWSISSVRSCISRSR